MEQKKSSDQMPDVVVGAGLTAAAIGSAVSGGDPLTGGDSLPGNDPNAILRRNNRGCKSKDFYNWPEQPFEEMDSPLAVQQYIQQVINRNPADIDEILRLPEGQELGAWKIEHLRMFCMQLNRLASYLQDCCHPETCNQMTATEQWIFLCAAHKQPNECPAIDYTRHTLDGAASLLNSNKYFPSRVTIKESSVAKLGSVCRRVYRIFSHAYYHHFQIFDDFERETHLCKRFSKFVTMYELMPKESLIVPADGSKPELESEKPNATQQPTDTTVIDSTTTAGTGVIATPDADATLGAAVATETTQQMATTTASDPSTNDPESKFKIKLEPIETTTPPIKTTTTAATVVIQRTVTPSKADVKPHLKTEASPTSSPPKQATATASPPKSTVWSPGQSSTNTMVKNSSSMRAQASAGSPIKKPELETKTVKTNSSSSVEKP